MSLTDTGSTVHHMCHYLLTLCFIKSSNLHPSIVHLSSEVPSILGRRIYVCEVYMPVCMCVFVHTYLWQRPEEDVCCLPLPSSAILFCWQGVSLHMSWLVWPQQAPMIFLSPQPKYYNFDHILLTKTNSKANQKSKIGQRDLMFFMRNVYCITEI